MFLAHSSHFKEAATSVFNFPPKVVHFKQDAIIGFHSHLLIGIWANFYLAFSKRCDRSFFDLSLAYIKFLFPINKQFSNDYLFLIGRSLLGFCSSRPNHSNILVKIYREISSSLYRHGFSCWGFLLMATDKIYIFFQSLFIFENEWKPRIMK